MRMCKICKRLLHNFIYRFEVSDDIKSLNFRYCQYLDYDSYKKCTSNFEDYDGKVKTCLMYFLYKLKIYSDYTCIMEDKL